MLDAFFKRKVLFTMVALVLLSIGFYYFVWLGEGASTESTPEPQEQKMFDVVLHTLDRFRTLDLTSDVLNRPSYQSLVDYRIEIPPQPRGRRNPFEGRR